MNTRVASTEFQTARRVNRSLTAAAEKRVLVWLAERAPCWVTSDGLTLLGFGAQIAAGLCFALARIDRRVLFAVVFCLAINWLGDSLDGTLARVRRQERPRYGFYVDHIVDIFGATALMCGLGCSGLLHWETAFAMLVTFLLLSAESYLSTYTLGCFELSQGMFGPTEIRILLAMGCAAVLHSQYAMIRGYHFLLFDLGGSIAAALMLLMVIAVAVRHMRALSQQEPIQ